MDIRAVSSCLRAVGARRANTKLWRVPRRSVGGIRDTDAHRRRWERVRVKVMDLAATAVAAARFTRVFKFRRVLGEFGWYYSE